MQQMDLKHLDEYLKRSPQYSNIMKKTKIKKTTSVFVLLIAKVLQIGNAQ